MFSNIKSLQLPFHEIYLSSTTHIVLYLNNLALVETNKLLLLNNVVLHSAVIVILLIKLLVDYIMIRFRCYSDLLSQICHI